MFEVRSLHKQYLGIPALDHVSFVARAGEVTGYLGANTRAFSLLVSTGQPRLARLFLKKRRTSLLFPVQSRSENALSAAEALDIAKELKLNPPHAKADFMAGIRTEALALNGAAC
jgi:hypothetical protein